MRRLADEAQATVDRLDILINNAGIGTAGPRQTSAEGFELRFAVVLDRARDAAAPRNPVQLGAGSSLIAKRAYSAAAARVNSLTASSPVK